jgi:hypothetical protein
MIIGVCLDLVAGPSDFIWHETFGVDGLLSPPHLTLITGMLLSSIGISVVLARIRPYFPVRQELIKILLVLIFAALWFTCIWYINWFTLPYIFQNGQTFNFMLQPTFASVAATILTPLTSSMMFQISSAIIGRFGAASCVAAIVLGINSLTNIVSIGNILTPYLPWYLLITVIPVIASDVVLHKQAIVSRIGIITILSHGISNACMDTCTAAI